MTGAMIIPATGMEKITKKNPPENNINQKFDFA
jgi:hypothetical protein